MSSTEDSHFFLLFVIEVSVFPRRESTVTFRLAYTSTSTSTSRSTPTPTSTSTTTSTLGRAEAKANGISFPHLIPRFCDFHSKKETREMRKWLGRCFVCIRCCCCAVVATDVAFEAVVAILLLLFFCCCCYCSCGCNSCCSCCCSCCCFWSCCCCSFVGAVAAGAVVVATFEALRPENEVYFDVKLMLEQTSLLRKIR